MDTLKLSRGTLPYTPIDYNHPSWLSFSPVCYLPYPLYHNFDRKFSSDPKFSSLGKKRRLCLFETMLVILFDICKGLSDKFDDNRLKGERTHASSWFCNLYSTLFRHRAGTGYKACVDWLVTNKFIHHSEFYRKATADCKGISKAYWLEKEYAEYYLQYLWTKDKAKSGNGSHPIGRLRSYKFKSIFTKRRLYLDLASKKAHLLKEPDIAELYGDLSHFRVDPEKARETMQALADSGAVPQERVDTEMAKVEKFGRIGEDPIAAYVIRDRYGRVHTNVTSLKKEIREYCISCDGKPVGSVDIKSSQAAFLCSVFGLWKQAADDPLHVPAPRFVKINPFWKTYEACDIAETIGKELEKFKKLLKDGRVYEYFAEKICVHDRKTVKTEWLAFVYSPIFFDRHKHRLRQLIRGVWKDEFPTLLKCIDAMKRDNYAALAHEMQSTESEFVFGGVIPLVRLFIGCPVCTVHDSLIVPADYVDTVKSIMDTELARTGIPTMTVAEMSIISPTVAEMRNIDRIRGVIEKYYAASGNVIEPGRLPAGSRVFSTVA